MAECSLAVSFNPLGRGVRVDDVNAEILATTGRAEPAKETARGTTRFVDSGLPLQEYEVEIRDRNGRAVPDRQIGQILLRGPSIMSGYLGDDQATQDVLSPDGWLDTGDLGYRVDGHLFVTGRSKDMIIVNGRNVWPQDLEYLAHQQPEIRSGDCLAFSALGEDGKDRAVMVVQSRDDDPSSREELVERLETLVRREIGIDCQVHLVPLHTLPRTSSGKLSRSKARQSFMADQAYDAHASEEKAGRDREDAA
jgi:fatty-acyl-CoA synthase